MKQTSTHLIAWPCKAFFLPTYVILGLEQRGTPILVYVDKYILTHMLHYN